MNHTNTPLLKIPLGQEAHRFAQQFAAQQATPQKGKRVYLNTLAVYAVHSYLNWLQIETNLRQSDSWHPAKRAIFDATDLALPDIGSLECRPVLPGETVFYVPPEVAENCIGYVGVQFSDTLSEVHLLGFIPIVDALLPSEQFRVSDFQPLDDLIDHLNQLISYVPQVQVPETSAPPEDSVSLSQWFQDTFEAGWQAVETLLGREKAHLALSFRCADAFREDRLNVPEEEIRRGKLIDLGIQLAGHPIALIVALKPNTEQEVDILIQLHPTAERKYLPPLMRLTVLDETGIPVLEAQSRSADNYIQLQFSGEPGERFSIKVALGDVSVTENFAI